MATTIFLSLLGSFSCIAIFTTLLAVKKRLFFYPALTFILKKVSLRLSKHKPFLFLYASSEALKALEELLQVTEEASLLLKNAQKNKNPSLLQLCAYVDESHQRSLSYFQNVKKIQKKEKPQEESFYKKRLGPLRGNCYFCSQPMVLPFLNKTTVRSEGKKLSAPSCCSCQKTLKKTHKIDTLYFSENKEKVHWSMCSSYTPQVKYWNINNNQKKISQKKQGFMLKLVPKQSRDKT